MNETHGYDPETFHPSVTHSVYVTLEGSRLHLAHPRANIPRWAAFDETPRDAVFSRSCTYQLANCKVSESHKGPPPTHPPTLPQGSIRERGKVTSYLNSSLSSLFTHFVI